MEERQGRRYDANRFRRHYDPDPLREHYDPLPDYDPDPFIISVPTLILFVVGGAVTAE